MPFVLLGGTTGVLVADHAALSTVVFVAVFAGLVAPRVVVSRCDSELEEDLVGNLALWGTIAGVILAITSPPVAVWATSAAATSAVLLGIWLRRTPPLRLLDEPDRTTRLSSPSRRRST